MRVLSLKWKSEQKRGGGRMKYTPVPSFFYFNRLLIEQVSDYLYFIQE